MEKAMKLVGWLILFSTIPFLISQQVAGRTTGGDVDQPEATPDSNKPVIDVDHEPLAEESHRDHVIDVDPHLYCARESGSASSSNWEPEAPASILDPRVVELGFGSQRGHKILGLYQTHELGRNVMALAIPVTSGIFSMPNPPGSTVVNLILVSIIIGFSAIWNGLLLRDTLPAGIANRLEQFGVSCLLAGGFGLIAVNLCPSLVWLPFLCWAFILFPFLLTFSPFPSKRKP